ncbi:MAG: DUF11 domain-containing protein [Thermoplasmata archaeon]|nr:DUF11 domain-containing protein [Thermoplasmata archaeon]
MAWRNRNSIWIVVAFIAFILASAFFMTAEAQSSQLAVNVISPDEVNVCEPTNYTLYINNTGTEPAHNITVNVSLLADFHYLNGSTIITFPNGTSNIDPVTSGQNLTWNLTPVVSSLGVNDTIKINFSAVAYCNASGGNLKATIYYDSKSTSASSSSILVNKGLLLIEKLPQQQEAGVGDTANWTVRVTNIGTGPLFNVTVIDTLGSGLVLVSTNATSWPVWHYDRIDVDESRIVYVAAMVMSCENLTNTVNATWGCHGICEETFAQGAIKLVVRPPDIDYIIEPDPIEVPYCGNATVWLNITNSGTGMAKNVRFFIKNMPSDYTITNVTGGVYYEINSTLYIGTINAGSSKNVSFQFGPKWQERCSASSSGTLLFDPKYEDQCGNPWAAPPVKYISFSRQSAPSVNLDITGPNLLHIGEDGTFKIVATYHHGGCIYNNITTNITGDFPSGFVVIDADGGTVNGSTIAWYNITLQDGISWIRNVTLFNEGECGIMVSGSVYMEAVPDCCYCPISANSSFQLASVCPQNYTMVNEIAWNRTASPSYVENSHNITYYNNITFYVNASWGDIWFRERANNGQTFCPHGEMNGTATFIINGSIYVSRNITLGQWFNLSFLDLYAFLANGTNLSIIYGIHQWNPGTFVAWADLYMAGHPNPDSQDGMYHSGVWVTVDRADYSIGIDIPLAVSDCGVYNATISIRNDSNWDCHDMVVVLNGTNYFYINNSTSITGIKYYNETLGKYVDVPFFEPEIIGSSYMWNFSKHGYGKIHSGGSITIGVIKRCDSPAGISASLSYKDNCNFEYVESAHDSPLMVTSGDLILLKTPEETFAYSRELNWRIYVINKGNGTAFNVVADDILPKNLSYVSSTIDGTADPANTTVSGHNITWYLGDMAPSECRIIEINANLTGCEYVNNYAEAKWGCINGMICQQVNDSSIVRLIVNQILVIRHDITAIDRCGDEAVVTIVLKNGQTDTYDVNVTEYLPENLTYVPGSWSVDGAMPSDFVMWRNNISWHFNYLPRGTTVTITFNVTISSPCAEISQSARAKVNYTLPCTAYGAEDTKDFIPQIAQPHLSITKTPDYISAKPGNVINWTITIISDGDYEAKNVTLHDILPTNVDYVSSSPSPSAGNGSSLNPLVWNLSNMSVGSSISINISALIKSCTVNDTINNATIEWGCCPLARESNNAFAYLRTSPDIILDQEHGEIIPCGGSFTITIYNNGSVANVSSIWFELPSGYVYKLGSAIITSSNASRFFASQEPIDHSVINGTIVWNNGNIDFVYYNETITIYFEIVDDGINCANDITSYANTTFHYRNTCNNSFTTNASQVINPHHPLLGVNISPSIRVLNENGSTATWTIYVSNNGDTTARNVSIVSILGSAFQNSSIVVKFSNGSIDAQAIVKDNSITWLNQTVPTGSNTWIRIIYANCTAGGATNHTVYVNGTCNSGCVYGIAKAKTFVARQNVSKFPDMVRTIGEYANFSINASLWGVGEVYRNASVEDILPSGLIYVNSTIGGIWAPDNTTVAGQHIVWRLGNITGVKNVTINISTIVADAAEIKMEQHC